MSAQKVPTAFQIEDGVRILRVELDEGFELLPYISFRGGKGASAGRADARSGYVELQFDMGVLTLHGKNLENLLLDLQCERVAVLRKGLGGEDTDLEITKLRFLSTEEQQPIA